MLKIVNGILDRIFAVVGGFILSQAPLFMQQYAQRLSGHVEELRIQISYMQNAAQLSGKNLSQYVGKFLSSTDNDFVNQGMIMQKMITRWENLTANLNQLLEASPWSHPFVFLSKIDYDIAAISLKNFQPGIAFNVETLFYLLAGIFFGYSFYAALRWSFRKLGSLFSSGSLITN